MRGLPPRGIELRRGFLDRATVERWRAALTDAPAERATVLKKDDASGTYRSVESERRATLSADAAPIADELAEAMDRFVAEVLGGEAAAEREVEWIEPVQMLRYDTGGHFVPHADSETYVKDDGPPGWRRVLDRDLSLLLYLNDDYRGGYLHFHRFRHTFVPRAGDAIAFPSDHRYEHEAMPVTAGVRWVAASWLALRGRERVGSEVPAGSRAVRADGARSRRAAPDAPGTPP